jgi:hypothetical protein
VAFAAALAGAAPAQQRADNAFRPHVAAAAFASGKGPVVLIDEGHYNFHTASGRYEPFARLVRADGYVVKSSSGKFSPASLKAARILVIANALNEVNNRHWVLPTPSAFTAEEIAAVKAWVEGGGSLLLIADHMPFGGAAESLATALGFGFNNAYALDPSQDRPGVIVFRRSDNSLRDHAILRGRSELERIDSIASFTGQAFHADSAAPLMVMRSTVMSFKPETAGQIDDHTPRIAVGGWYQGATRLMGKGRVAAFGEAAMFSAQISGRGATMGMNAPKALQNAQFALNVLHWLSGLLEPASP